MTDKNPERRLLEAMITLNAINNGRPVPDMSKIKGGWVTGISPGEIVEEIETKLINAIAADGITVNRSTNSSEN